MNGSSVKLTSQRLSTSVKTDKKENMKSQRESIKLVKKEGERQDSPHDPVPMAARFASMLKLKVKQQVDMGGREALLRR